MSLMQESLQPTVDVFAAARWFDGLWNSSGKAVSLEEVEWQCRTWGSGLGGGDWVDSAIFVVVASALGLSSWCDDDQRDALVVAVPVQQFPRVVRLIERLDEDVESWPWLFEDDRSAQIAVAADVLELSPDEVAENGALLSALRIG